MKTLALCAFIFFAGCNKESVTTVLIPPPIDTTAVIIPVVIPIHFEGTKITYYGNSITTGAGASNLKNRWTTLLSKRLNAIEDNRGISGTVLEKGTPKNPFGAAGTNMIDNLPTVPIKTDLLSLLVISYGINDVGYNSGTYTPENFLIAYDSVMNYVTTVKKWPTSNILLIAPNYLANLNHYTQYNVPPVTEERLLNFIAAVKKTSDKYHTLYASPYPVMKGKKELFPDGIHPSDSGHAILSNIIYSALPK